MSERVPRLSPEEYLAAEAKATVKHEYVDGFVYAMSGGSIEHSRIVSNLHTLLGYHLGEGPCEVLGSDAKLRVTATRFYYPDLMVCCQPLDMDVTYIEQPRYVFEVGSPSTARIDRTDKAASYALVPSIEAYVLVAQDERLVTLLQRPADGGATGASPWAAVDLDQPKQVLRLDGIGFEAPLSAIYARTPLASDT